ncbi:hypothetical protein L1987_64135 [Smallanthus sonchifolius]|uniref:Uncharacterized protein n=1 Tax=Smallanthus sonchifolius TaxID=185202 RepID=A0ACB9CF49_9ASTR|nr:hypothetical protein L1987_64135 [Smallanthus sonchifolius]
MIIQILLTGLSLGVLKLAIVILQATATKKVKLDLMELLNRSAPTGVCTKQLHYKAINGSREGHKRVKRKQLQRRSN